MTKGHWSRYYSLLAILVTMILASFLFAACETTQEPRGFPPPEGYSSWEEYRAAYREQTGQQVTEPPASESELTPEAYKASCITISYDSLARNTEQYIGQHVYYRGEVLQVMELGLDLYVLRIAVTQTEYDWWDSGDAVWVNYLGPRILEDDIVDFWGVVEGRKSYIAVLGNEIVIPEVTALYLELATSGTIPQTTPEPTEEANLSASFEITEWEQEYYEYIDEWSDYVDIYYEVENTGDAEIDYYKVYFAVKCKGGKEYYDWDNGGDVPVGRKLSDHTIIDVAGRKVRSVEITDWELEHY